MGLVNPAAKKGLNQPTYEQCGDVGITLGFVSAAKGTCPGAQLGRLESNQSEMRIFCESYAAKMGICVVFFKRLYALWYSNVAMEHPVDR